MDKVRCFFVSPLFYVLYVPMVLLAAVDNLKGVGVASGGVSRDIPTALGPGPHSEDFIP